MANIGENIRRLREKNGMTQEELARRMGYTSKTTINKIERGVNDIPQSKIERFAECLNTDPSVLMGWVTEEQSHKNDELVDITLRLRSDATFFENVKRLAKLDADQTQAIMTVLRAFEVTDK